MKYYNGGGAQIARLDHSLESVKYLDFDDDVYGVRVNEFKDYLNYKVIDKDKKNIKVDKQQ